MRYEPPIDRAQLIKSIRLLRRYLGDMTVRLMRIVQENTTAEEDEDALGGIEMWGFAQWSILDDTLAIVAAALGSHGA